VRRRVECARFFVVVLPAGDRMSMPRAIGASGSFCHGEYCAFMPIADLIDSGIESIGRALSYFFTRIILTFNLYPDKNSVILIPASGRPR